MKVIKEDINNVETPSTPLTMVDSGIASVIMNLIKDEYEAIEGYNGAIETLKYYGKKYENFIEVLKDIANEENIHIGQLQEILTTVSPNAKSIDDGVDEAEEQLGLGEGELQ